MKFTKILFSISFVSVIGSGYVIWNKFSLRPVPLESVFPGKVWSKTIPQLPKLDGVGEPRAENCGKCHTEIYKEWQSSTHAHALSDLQFQAELSKPGQPEWICLNCHIPVQNQRETRIEALNHGDFNRPIEAINPGFDLIMKNEAVTCATCHVRVDEVGKAYVLGGNGKTSPPHPVRIDQQKLRTRCLDCHNETYNLSSSLVCYFKTGDEMKEAQPHFPGKDCVSCHLPDVKRSFVDGVLKKPIRNSHKHAFIGGGVPKEFSLYEKQIPGGYKPGVILNGWEQSKSEEIKITYQNANAGHYVPSGDPERFLRLELVFLDEAQREIEKKVSLIGQTWKWNPEAELVSENRLRPKETRIWKEKIPSNQVTKIIFRIYHVKLKETTSAYMSSSVKHADPFIQTKISSLKENYPHSSIILESTFDLKSKRASETSLQELFKRNEKRRGE